MKSDLHNVIKNKKVLYIRCNIKQAEVEMRKGKVSQICKMDINCTRSQDKIFPKVY